VRALRKSYQKAGVMVSTFDKPVDLRPRLLVKELGVGVEVGAVASTRIPARVAQVPT